MVCLDTDVIIDFFKNENKAARKISSLKLNGAELSTTTINAFELFRGNNKLSEKSSIDSVDVFLNNVKVYDLDLESSRKAAEIYEHLKSKGEMIELTDVMIASIAIANEESLLTNNIKHFQKINELRIEKF